MSAANAVSRFGMNLIGARTKARAQKALWGYAFVAPWVIGLLAFSIGPMIASFYYGFTEYDGLGQAKWVGAGNYIKAFTSDDLFWPAISKTFVYALTSVPLSIVGSLLFAILLNQNIKGRNVFRTILFMPHLTPTVASSVLWIFLLHPYVGPLNAVLGKLGLPQPGWFEDTGTALIAVIMVTLWTSWGGNAMLIFLAGLQGVPVEQKEAAEIDGANALRRFWHITLPMISPTMFFNVVMGIIGALKVFNLAYVATRGGPNYATWFLALHIYVQSFKYYRMGYGCTLAWIFTFILLVLTLAQAKLSDRWVFYAG